jgi:methylenetetrahydrofolate dehydrogenase (NADP+)/methenyltetrahydrofolate cyclohydrolase
MEKVLYAQPVIDDMFKSWRPTHKGMIIFANPNDPAGQIYVNNKKKFCEKYGVFCKVESQADTEFLYMLHLYIEQGYDCMVQEPLYNKGDLEHIKAALVDTQDVDAIGGDLRDDYHTPCTPLGVLKLMDYYGIDVDGKNVVVIGRSEIVGHPMFELLLRRNATVTICHSHTDRESLTRYTRNADIIISAVGKKNMVTGDMINENAILIDVGINRLESGKITGDFSKTAKEKCKAYTPVPKGIGPMTVATLIWKLGENNE